MLKHVGREGEHLTAICDCFKQHTISLAQATETANGYSFAPIICVCGAKHVMCQGKPISPEEIMRWETEERAKSILVTSLPTLEGYRVVKHYELISCEVVLGTGFFSEWNATKADFWGTRSDRFEGKLARAKALAMEELKIKAAEVGANAVIGADIDYHSLVANMLMVVVNGTPVLIEEC